MASARNFEDSFENTPNNELNNQSKNMSSTTSDEVSLGRLDNMTEVEFKALEILENGFEKIKYLNIFWNGDSVTIFAPISLVQFAKQNLNSRLRFLRNKQSDEIYVDEKDKIYVKDVIGEVQSKDIIFVFDEKNSRVVVYSDKQEDIIKFKHQLKLRIGKLKKKGRKIERFTEDAQTLKTSQKYLSLPMRSSELEREFSWSKDTSNVEIFNTSENIKVAVYKADILNLPVDCIVNAANVNLWHDGGVAKVIADTAGPELVQQGNAAIMEQKNGKLPVSFQVTTTAGKLPYKYMIHTVGPCWSNYQPHNLQKLEECEKDLYAAIYGCFLEAEKYGISTIALPIVSSGLYAVPKDMCAVQYAKAVFDYSRQSIPGKSVKEIHFIDKFPDIVEIIQDTFRTMIENGKVPNYDIQKYVACSASHQRQKSKETGRKGREKQHITANHSQYETIKLKEMSPFCYEPIVQHTKQFVFQVSSKPVVCIYEGDIQKVKNIDAVVCPDDIKGNGKSSIALKLAKKTKYKKQKEICFESEKPNLGDVVITYRKKTHFNVIVHVVIENNSTQKLEFISIMKKSIDNILRKTNECVTVKTIAMPMFGVEQELLTEKCWAELFLERFVDFCSEVKNPNLEEVHIITHASSSSAYSTVKNVFHGFVDEINNSHVQKKVPPPRPPPPTKTYRTSDYKQGVVSDKGYESQNDEGDRGDSCTICMCPKTDPKSLSCGHSFCSECIDQMFKHKPVCPVCGKIVGTLTGDQPVDGRMDVKTSSMSLAGYDGCGCIVITYEFPAGKQGPSHPSPGTFYDSMKRTAYLPDTSEGRTVCRMLQLAFERRLVFTISQSRTTGKEGLTWNDIHHKTNPKPGGQFGYPDPEYLSRVKDELAAKGITEADFQPEEIRVPYLK
ncbi:hypothetical protein CHS0354_016674 [Potamilus streckersoni]|uniref:E3 ubiquitin-protein ligase n=1 Tax=Potamilus streckersoni TaxID=2493646 RepID=A0AAE0WDR9_9BIVA|nr:hypothetical protein CHS0354_016674 [Potamilus streckersoni]